MWPTGMYHWLYIWLHKNIERHTAHTIVSWPNPKQWVIVMVFNGKIWLTRILFEWVSWTVLNYISDDKIPYMRTSAYEAFCAPFLPQKVVWILIFIVICSITALWLLLSRIPGHIWTHSNIHRGPVSLTLSLVIYIRWRHRHSVIQIAKKIYSLQYMGLYVFNWPI